MVTQLLPISPDGELLARIPGQLVTLVQQGAARLYDDGTLRYTALSDRHPGGIAGWLQPTDPQSIPPNNILGALQNMTSLMVGLQAVNVAVTAVGFAIVINKLTGIEHKLTQLDEKMDQILSEVRLLRVTVAEGFARVEQRFDRKLLAEAMGAVHTVADLLTTGKVLDAGFLHSLYTVETELLGEIQPAMFAGRYAHAAMLIECLANISIAHTLAWLGEEQWQQAKATIDDAATGLEPLCHELVRRLLGGWPSVYLPLPAAERDRFALALRVRHPCVQPRQLVPFVLQRYPLVNAGRTSDFGNLEIPIPLASDPGVYVTVPDLRAEDIYARFMAGKVATVHLAARVVALIVMVHRTRELVRAMESRGISRPLALQGDPAMEGFEVFEG